MSRQVQDAYIVAAARTPIGKAPRGAFRNTRPDDLLVAAIRGALARVPSQVASAGRIRSALEARKVSGAKASESTG